MDTLRQRSLAIARIDLPEALSRRIAAFLRLAAAFVGARGMVSSLVWALNRQYLSGPLTTQTAGVELPSGWVAGKYLFCSIELSLSIGYRLLRF